MYCRFGANDAAIDQNCSVPKDEFRLNLNAIVEHLSEFFEHIVVISPTPVNGERRIHFQTLKYGVGATGILERTTKLAGEYRDIAADIAQQNGVFFLDLYYMMLNGEEGNWHEFVGPDGLHLSARGQDFVATQVISLLEESGLGANSIPHDFYPWDQKTPGESYEGVMCEYENSKESSRTGLGLDMPNFPLKYNFDECGVTLTSLITLDVLFKRQPQLRIIGFGSLMSEKSARTTFPNLSNFRIVRVQGYRRVFRHPAAIFFERGIANLDTLQISSLSTEKNGGSSFIASVFTIEGESADSFLEREEEFDFQIVPFTDIRSEEEEVQTGSGLMCIAGADENYVARWGLNCYKEKYLSRGLRGIWNWEPDSGILPCSVYLRHCYLSAKKLTDTPEIFESFMNDTYLCDRVTTIAEYLESHPEVLTTPPPENLAGRYSG